MGQESKGVDRYLWDEIGEYLGVITDVELRNDNAGSFKCEVHFKSNGIDKVMYSSEENFKFFIQCVYYVSEIISPLKRYKQSSLTLQNSSL